MYEVITTDTYIMTDCEQKLLEVLVNPEHHGLNVLEKCQIANISRDTYYRLIKKPEFIKILTDMSFDLIKSRISEIVNATISHALKDPKCHSDRKMLLELINVYKERQQIDINPNNDFDEMSREEREARIMDLLNKRERKAAIDADYKALEDVVSGTLVLSDREQGPE